VILSTKHGADEQRREDLDTFRDALVDGHPSVGMLFVGEEETPEPSE
jgi:hypothetical protein